jgi:hypothetical protein
MSKAMGTTSSVCLAIVIWFVNDNEVLEDLTNWLIQTVNDNWMNYESGTRISEKYST